MPDYPSSIGASGIWSLTDIKESIHGNNWVRYTQVKGALIGKFFNGDWRSAILTGDIGTFPLNSVNNSSNVTGTGGMPSAAHRYGVNSWSSIAYTTIGDLYGFIAIGYFTPPSTGTYTFFTSSDDGSGVWIGDMASATRGRTVNNAVTNNGLGIGQGNTKRSGTIFLTSGIMYPIRIVHEEGGGGDNLTFSWSGPGISETTSLATHFSYFNLLSSNSIYGDYI
jgi:hypothetical protein